MTTSLIAISTHPLTYIHTQLLFINKQIQKQTYDLSTQQFQTYASKSFKTQSKKNQHKQSQ